MAVPGWRNDYISGVKQEVEIEEGGSLTQGFLFTECRLSDPTASQE